MAGRLLPAHVSSPPALDIPLKRLNLSVRSLAGPLHRSRRAPAWPGAGIYRDKLPRRWSMPKVPSRPKSKSARTTTPRASAVRKVTARKSVALEARSKTPTGLRPSEGTGERCCQWSRGSPHPSESLRRGVRSKRWARSPTGSSIFPIRTSTTRSTSKRASLSAFHRGREVADQLDHHGLPGDPDPPASNAVVSSAWKKNARPWGPLGLWGKGMRNPWKWGGR